jgi:peroxiredoxin
MSASILKISTVETLELITDPEYNFTSFQKLSPVKAGTSSLALSQIRVTGHRFFDEIVLNTTSQAFSYNHKPLLFYFYEEDWRDVAHNHLRQLNNARQELYANNINLLVVTARSLNSLLELSHKEDLFIEVFEDADNELAKMLNLYSEQSPTWNSYSGIESNIALPALYLLGSSHQIVLDFANENIEPRLPLESVIPVLQANNAYWENKKSA